MNEFLDKWLPAEEEPQDTSQGPGYVEELVQKVASDPMLPAKIVSGMIPADVAMKQIDLLSEKFKQPIKQALEPTMEGLSNEPVMRPELQQQLNMTNPAELGMALGGNVSPRQGADVALDIAIDPRTYLLGMAGKGLKAEQIAGAVAPTVEELNTPVQKIIRALNEAKPIRGAQEALYSAERAKRAGAIAGIGKNIPGEEGYIAQLGALKGEMPKVQFEGLRGAIAQPDIDSLFNSVEQHGVLLPFEKITAKTGLAKLLGAEGGMVPTEGELKLLGEVFPSEFVNTVMSKRPLIQKFAQGAEEVVNVPRAIMASTDVSAPFRQGAFLVGRPKQWMPAFKDMFKYFFNEKSYAGLMENIQQRPTYALMRESGLPLTDIGAKLSGREEAFMSNLAEKIPGYGKVIKASNRAYSGFLNKLRADVFDDMVRSAEKQGLKVEGKLLNDISMFIGSATGRGKLPGALERSAVALNSVFFSPRLMASRLNLMNPVYYVKLDPFVRKEALKSLLTFGATASTILSLAKMGGAEVGSEPTSADFGKIKVDDTRYDLWGGFQQYVRAGAQMLTGVHTSSTTGVRSTMGEGYKPLTRREILLKFGESKLAPVPAFINTLLKGQDPLGKKIDVKSQVAQLFIPMVLRDTAELAKEKGMQGLAMSIPGYLGVGIQTYAPTPDEIVHSTNSVMKNYKDLVKQGRRDEADKLLAQNQELIQMGRQFAPAQKIASSYEKLKESVEKNVRLSPAEKKRMIEQYDEKIKYFRGSMESRLKEIKNRENFQNWKTTNIPVQENDFIKKWGQ